jgi:hypothetical protein
MRAMAPLLPVPAAHALNVRRVEAGGFRWVHARHAEGYVGPHAHADATLTLVVAGGYQEMRGPGATENFAVGSAWLRPAGEPYANRFPVDGIESLVVEISPGRAAEIAECWPGIHGCGRFDSPLLARVPPALRLAAGPLSRELM